ncbi:MAG: hypothetical protein ACRDDZ_07955 [Marinifilaceae bacterium]
MNHNEILFLSVKQKDFNKIADGTTTEEFCEITDTSFGKYLKTTPEGWLQYDKTLCDEAPLDCYTYNGGEFPFLAIPYTHIKFGVGYDKKCDTLLAEIKGISFEVAEGEDGKEARYRYTDEDGFVPDEHGDNAVWLVVYHLGKVERSV